MKNDHSPTPVVVCFYTFMQTQFLGFNTALITPFKDGAVDEVAFQRHVDWQIGEGIHGIVPHGTTGESPTIEHSEVARIFKIAVETSAGRVPVIAGCGANSTQEAIHLSRIAEKAGCNANLQVTPYYNKPTQEGLFRHFKAVHDATNLPIILYDIPGRAVVRIDVETQKRLADLPRIVGVKDSSGDITRPVRTGRSIGKMFSQLSGDDAFVLPFLAQGGHGCISVTSNIAPRLCVALYDAWQTRDIDRAQDLNGRLLPLHDALFCETSPGPVKYAASRLGICRNELRLPMVPASEMAQKQLDRAMSHLGLTGPK